MTGWVARTRLLGEVGAWLRCQLEANGLSSFGLDLLGCGRYAEKSKGDT
jgi:hypothetical protein